MSIVGTGRTPQPVDEGELDAVRVLAGSPLQLEPWPFLAVGERVQIVDGPLAGAVGVLQAAKKGHRFVVAVTLLQRAVAVEVPEACLWPLAADLRWRA